MEVGSLGRRRRHQVLTAVLAVSIVWVWQLVYMSDGRRLCSINVCIDMTDWHWILRWSRRRLVLRHHNHSWLALNSCSCVLSILFLRCFIQNISSLDYATDHAKDQD